MSVAFRPHVILIYESLYGLPKDTYLWIWIWQSGHVLFINVKMILELKTLVYFQVHWKYVRRWKVTHTSYPIYRCTCGRNYTIPTPPPSANEINTCLRKLIKVRNIWFFSPLILSKWEIPQLSQFVYFLRQVCSFFNFWMIKCTIMSNKT